MERVVTAGVFCAAALLVFPAVAGAETTPTPTPTPAASQAAIEEKYGTYPIAYREIITRWLGTQLLDPASAQIEWTSDPKRVELKGRDGEMFFGYIVEFKVNSRNQFGAYTGKQARKVYIRNGEVAAGGRVKR